MRAEAVQVKNALAARVWMNRARMEHEAAWRFHALAEDLAAAGALTRIVQMARDAAEDERRHVVLCERLAVHFGGIPAPAPDPARPKSEAMRQRVLLEAIAVSCVTETRSAAVLGELAERATDDRVRQTVHEILKDEVQHARIGWAHLAAESAKHPAAFVSEHLPAILAGTVEEELFEPAEAQGLDGLGSLDRAVRLDLFRRTLDAVIFPGLERYGTDTAAARAWVATSRLPACDGPSRASRDR